MQAAASIAASAASFGTSVRLASGALPVGAVTKPPGAVGPAWRHTRTITSMLGTLLVLLVAAPCEVHVLELELLLVQLGRRADAFELPRGDVAEVVVVAERLALFRLVLDSEVTAARLLAVQRVAAQQLAELEEVGHPARLLERLVERLVLAEHPNVGVELVAQSGNLAERLLETLAAARHAALVPEDVAEL